MSSGSVGTNGKGERCGKVRVRFYTRVVRCGIRYGESYTFCFTFCKPSSVFVLAGSNSEPAKT